MKNSKNLKALPGGFAGLAEKRETMVDEAVIEKTFEKHGACAGLLGSASRKILKYLFDQYPETVKAYIAAKQSWGFEKTVRYYFGTTTSFPPQILMNLDDIFPVLLRHVPAVDEYSASVYGRL